MAQMVARNIGSVEVTGSIPVASLEKGGVLLGHCRFFFRSRVTVLGSEWI